MLGSIIFFALLFIGAAVAYLSYRFDDPSVPVVSDVFPPRTEAPLTLLEIWSHPDDETGMGGTTAKYGRDPQVRVVACYFTCGEAGRPGVPPICTQEELGEVRRGEMAVAAHAVHMSTHEVADFGDGTLQERDFAELEAQAVRWIRTYRPTVIFSWDPSGATGHPDHLRTHEVVRAAFHAAADPGAYSDQVEAGLEPYQAQRLYEMVVPVRLVDFYRGAAFMKNTQALDHRATPSHAVDVRPYTRERIRLARAHRTQRHGLGPIAAWYSPFVYFCWRKEYFALALTAEPSASQ